MNSILSFNNDRLRFYISIFLMFMFIYAPRLSFPFYINTSILIFLIVLFFFKIKLFYLYKSKNIFIITLFLLFLALYNFCISIFYNNNPFYFTTILISNIVYLSFGIMFYFFTNYLHKNIYDNTIYFFKIILICIILNSLIIILEFISPNFKIAL